MLYDIGIVKRRRIISPNESYFAVPAPVAGVPAPDAIFGANLIAWYDAADNFTSGHAIDRTANHNDLINQSNLVTYNATDFNGHPGFVFTAASFGGLYAGTGASSNAFPPLGGTGAVFIALKGTASTESFGRLVSMGPGASANDFSLLTAIESALTVATPSFSSACNNVSSTSGTIVFGTYYRVAQVWNTPTFWTYINNVATDAGANAGGTINIGNGANMSFAFGSSFDGAGTTHLDGTYGAMVVVNITPSPTQRSQMDAYFTDRFGI